ncbi:MAG TPA: adenylate/guanylate cyclase domain-containing protein [Nitrososphaeraceae archaeon]|nr:adenylate/guanylate cyclase domain-containing protein [Nitrososphaeraceae archaeon]
MNSDNSFFKEKELNFVDLLSSSSLSTNTNENQSSVKDHRFYYEEKYTSDKDKSILNKNNNFSQITDIQTYIAETEKRVLEAFEKGSRLSPRIERSDQFLQQHAGSKLKLVVLYVDLVDSTLMTRDFSVDKLATIIQMFTQEMSVAATNFNGQVLKYVGDAVIAYFPIEVNDSISCSSAINCAFHMITIIEQGINPVLRRNNCDQIQVKIGIDASEHSIIQYVLGEKSYIDILGYGISMSAKLIKLAEPNQIITSHGIYMNMHPSLRKRFVELEIAPRIWKYTDEKIQPGVWKSLDKT